MMATITARVQNKRGDLISGVSLLFFDRTTSRVTLAKGGRGGDYTADLDSGKTYSAIVTKPGYAPEATDITVQAGGGVAPIILQEETSYGSLPVGSLPGSLPPTGTSMDPVFLDQLIAPDTSLEAAISIEEAEEATSLFSVVNLVFAGLVQEGDMIDVLGVRKLFFGWRKSDDSEIKALNVSDQVIADLIVREEDLQKKLEESKADFEFLRREAKRQFNLGTDNTVVGNIQFPSLFKRYVEVSSDVRISIDLRLQKENPILDKVKLEEAYLVLRNLRDIIIQVVRSLSKYGTKSTSITNKKWSAFAGDALKALVTLGQARTNVDTDEMTPWAVLALLTKKPEVQLMPYAALYRHGYRLLKLAVDIYTENERKLETNDSDTLVTMFQPTGKPFWTTLMREQAEVIQRYPLTNWG